MCWNTGGAPTTADSKTEEGAGNTGAFTSSITGLSTNILYYVRAYAINEFGTSYGGEVSFTSLELATVTTQAVSNIAATTATGNGNVTDLGNPNPTAHGVCWNTTGSPTTADNTTDEGAKGSTGAFTTSMTSLTPNETYYVKAYATNTAGTSYGSEVSFQALGASTVTTQTMEYVLGTTAVGRGTITVLGTPAPTAHGHVWGESVDPTTSDTTEDNGAQTTTGTFTSNFSDTVPGTPYWTRAFATNIVGTSYGFNVYFIPPTTGVSGRAGYIWMEGQHFHGFNENAVEITMEDMDNPRILTWLGL